tara:strand:+ start:7113 stop:8327 length:1215 start_codon:yes stop_codon:yes gene_type:complete
MAETNAFEGFGPTFRQRLQQSPGKIDADLKYLYSAYENTPVEAMISSSPLAFRARWSLPEWLGGFTDDAKNRILTLRKEDPVLRRFTSVPGLYPDPESATGREIGQATLGRKLGSGMGTLIADIMQDGARNIWWFLNAPQALAQLVTLQAVSEGTNAAEKKALGVDQLPYEMKKPTFRRKGMRLAATLPAVAGISYAIGNVGRQDGYKAIIPDENDPRKSADPVSEILSRYFLGRTGRLLPYNEFIKERPDVSPEQYKNYKQYLFSGMSPVKATTEGIHGPEVTFLGKSIPLTTGVLPLVAAAAGGYRGSRNAATRLRANRKKAVELGDKVRRIKKDLDMGKRGVTKVDLEKAATEYLNLETANEVEALKSIMLNSGVGVAGGITVGSILESMRRGQSQRELES